MRRGVRLGVDVGTVRVGVARSDPDGLLAVPMETVQRRGDVQQAVDRVLAIAAETGAIELVVGLPIALSGRDTASTADARAVAARLAAGGAVVRMVDERLTTVSAQGALRSSGRNTRQGRQVVDQVAAVILLQHALDAERAAKVSPRPVIDQVAAVILLQHALDAERARGEAPGVLVEPKSDRGAAADGFAEPERK